MLVMFDLLGNLSNFNLLNYVSSRLMLVVFCFLGNLSNVNSIRNIDFS